MVPVSAAVAVSPSWRGSVVGWGGSAPRVSHLAWASGLAKAGSSSGSGRDAKGQASSYNHF